MPAKLLASGVTTISPPASSVLWKTIQISRSDTTAFDAVGLPAGAVIIGSFITGNTNSDAATTATITVGTAGTPTGIVNAFNVKTSGAGFFHSGTSTGALVGTQLTADAKLRASYAETGTASTTGGPWLVNVLYYLPQAGNAY